MSNAIALTTKHFGKTANINRVCIWAKLKFLKLWINNEEDSLGITVNGNDWTKKQEEKHHKHQSDRPFCEIAG